MVSNIISKYIIIILVLLIIGLLNQSCTDSYGIDPNVKVTVNDNPTDTSDGGGGTSDPKPYKITKYGYNVLELFRVFGKKYWDEWVNPIDTNLIEIDTVGGKVKLSMNLNINNPKKNMPMDKRRDRIIKIALKFSAFIAEDKEFYLNGNPGDINSIKIEMETIDQNQQKIVRYFHGLDNKIKIKIERLNLIDKIIDLRFDFDPSEKFDTEQLIFNMKLFY